MSRSVWSVVFSTLVCLKSYGGAILIDDFSSSDLDGWVHTVTAEGKPWGPARVEVVDGEFLHGTTGEVPPRGAPNLSDGGLVISEWSQSKDDPSFSDGYLRAKVRAEPTGDQAGNVNLLMRYDNDTISGYVIYASGANNYVGISSYVNGALAGDWWIGPIFTTGEDWMMDFGAVGDQLSLKAWKAGDAEPARPQLEVTDDAHQSGTIGVTSAVQIARIQAPVVLSSHYDDIYFTPVPEPSGLVLAMLALAGVLVYARRRV